MKWFLRIAVVILVLIGVRTALGLGLAKAHYESTPRFREWARAHVADDELWRTSVPAGTELSSQLPWRSEEEPSSEPSNSARVWSPHLVMKHGQETVLEVALEIVFETAPDSDQALEALAISASANMVDPDFHGVVVLSIANPPAESAAELGMEPLFPNVRVDAFALSGPGEVEFVVQEMSGPADPTGESRLVGEGDFAEPSWDWIGRLLLGLPCSFEEPPTDGLVYALGTMCYGGQSLGNWRFAGSSEQYSIELRGEQSIKQDGSMLSTSAHRGLHWTWQERTW